MRMVKESIADGIGHGRFADRWVPCLDRQLSRDERRPSFASVLDHLEQVTPLNIRERRQQPIVQRQQIDLREPRE